jgi:hypothetical protein
MQSPTCPRCQSHKIRQEERQHIYNNPAVPEPRKFMWQCLNQECKHIWPI